ncbi:MAG: hypothetical protein JW395_3773 [Nitrospira sp.]|nr:hypothetical protein [Nitrospira sp.]
MGIMIPMGLKRFFGRRAETFDQTCAKDVAVRDGARSDGRVFIMHQRNEGGIEVP